MTVHRNNSWTKQKKKVNGATVFKNINVVRYSLRLLMWLI